MFIKKGNAKSIQEVVLKNTGLPLNAFVTDTRDPFIKNLKEAARLILDFLKKPNARVTIVGDYDADGILATTILYWGFLSLEITAVRRIPRRFSEGYGLNPSIVDEIPDGLLITVDNGITAMEAVQGAKEKGLTVIVTDHHLPKRKEDGSLLLPEADVIVDPHIESESEFSDYCGAALAYRLVKELKPNLNSTPLLTLAAIATVTDVMPLTGANRTLVRDGLSAIARRGQTSSVVPGLRELLTQMNLDEKGVDEETFGFSLGPAFNAPGRLYDSGAATVVDFLCLKNQPVYLIPQAQWLLDTNEKRKKLVKTSLPLAESLCTGRPIVVYHSSFHEGIIGILAGKLAEEQYCPAIVFTDSATPGVLKGSARSIPEVHLEHVLSSISDQMVGFGGHAGAAGLSIRKENLSAFTEAFREAVGTLPEKPKDAFFDLEFVPSRINSYLEELERFAPFGEGNPAPVFHAEFDTRAYRFLGEDEGTLLLKSGWMSIMGFGLAEKFRMLGCPERISCIGTLSTELWRGRKSPRFTLIDLERA